MITYRVSGTEQNGEMFSVYVKARPSEMRECIRAGDKEYSELKPLLVNQKLMETAAKITTVERIKFETPEIWKIQFNTKSDVKSDVPAPVGDESEIPVVSQVLSDIVMGTEIPPSASTDAEVQSPLLTKSETSPSESTDAEKSIDVTKGTANVQPVSKPVYRRLAQVACYGISTLSAITVVAGGFFVADHYLNSGSLRGRLFEQLRLWALNEMPAQETEGGFCPLVKW